LELNVSGKISKILDLSPYKVKTLVVTSSKKVEIEVEIPEKILADIGWTPSEGDTLKLVFSEKKEKVLSSEIAYHGKIYGKEGDEAYISFGGLLAKIKGPISENFEINSPIYLGISRASRKRKES